MEKGFFHPHRGYWQSVGEASQDILDGYPEGTVEVPIKPSGDHEWDGTKWKYVAPNPAIARASIPPLSFAQLLTGLVAMGWITEAEGMDWLMAVALPAEITALIAGLPAEVRFGTTARALRMSEAVRNDPLVDALASVRDIPPEDIDLFFNTFSGV